MNSRTNQDLENQLKPFIPEGEKLLWIDQPELTPIRSKKSFFLFSIGALFLTVVFIMVFRYYQFNEWKPFNWFAMPILILGAIMMFVIPFVVLRDNRNTIYAFSESRLFIKKSNNGGQVLTFKIKSIDHMELKEINNLSSIELSASNIKLPTLRGIKNGKSIYQLLIEIIEDDKKL